MLSFDIDMVPQLFRYSFIALSMIRCSKSALKSAVHMCQVTNVVMKTTQLLLSQFKSFFIISVKNWIRFLSLFPSPSLPKIISGRCELVKLYHINCSGPGFYRASAYWRAILIYVCLSVCLSVCSLRSGIRWKRLNISLQSFFHHTVAQSF